MQLNALAVATQSVGILLISIGFLLPSLAMSAEDNDILGDGFGQTDAYTPGKRWSEAEVPVPALPQESNLLGFKVYQRQQYKYYIDEVSLHTTGGDNIVRYTVIIETSSGLRNLFYEGIRCDTAQFKTYATGIWGQPFIDIKSPQWQPITDRGVTAYRANLYRDYFCKDSIIRDKRKDIIMMLSSEPDHIDMHDI